MSKQANPAAIGGFVIGAVVLLTVAVMTFGGSQLFKEKSMFVTYINGSVKGLKVGSNVLFRGARVGYVTEVQLIAEVETLDFRTAVYLEIFPDALTLVRDGVRVNREENEIFTSIEELIEVGMRATLGTESFVTGQLVVALDLHPDKPAVFRGVKVRHPEIPSIPSDIQQVLESLQAFIAKAGDNIDIGQAMRDIQGTLSGLNELANSEEIRSALAGVDRLVNAEDTQQLTASLRATLSKADEALSDIQTLVKNADGKLEPVLDGLGPAVEDLRATLADGRLLLRAAEARLGENSQLTYRLDRSLKEVEGAARSLRIFLDQLEQEPESLLKGRRNQ